MELYTTIKKQNSTFYDTNYIYQNNKYQYTFLSLLPSLNTF